jgi:hypothetical protein
MTGIERYSDRVKREQAEQERQREEAAAAAREPSREEVQEVYEKLVAELRELEGDKVFNGAEFLKGFRKKPLVTTFAWALFSPLAAIGAGAREVTIKATKVQIADLERRFPQYFK